MKNLNKKCITKNQQTRLYHLPVPIIGLTGGIGSGKSTVAQLLRQKNIPVIDADVLVKNIYKKNETIQFISKHFPEAMINGNIDFKTLREIAFSDNHKKIIIEDFIYSYLPKEFNEAFNQFQNPLFVVYDVPLLFEKKLNDLVDISACVYSPRETQRERIIKRDNSNIELANKILDNQMDIEEKRNLADFVLSNTGSLQQLELAVAKWLEDITA